MATKFPEIKPTRPNRNRNAFDLSQRHLFTAHAGMLLPVLSLDLLPHDHVEINATDFMRTLPMNTAAFASLRSVYEFFFVPYHQLYSNFDQFITGMNDYNSRIIYDKLGSNTIKQLPFFDISKLHEYIIRSDSNHIDDCGFKSLYGKSRLLDLLGYGRFFDSSFAVYDHVDGSYNPIPSSSCSPFRILAYNKIYNDYYRNNIYEDSDPHTFNMDGLSGYLTENNIFGILQLRYRNVQQDYFSNVRPSQLLSVPISPDSFSQDILHAGKSSLGNVLSKDNDTFISTSDSKFSIGSLRGAFALDKLASITMRAGKTFREQMRAHYGVDIPDGRDGRVTYIGGFDSDIQISDVTQTSGSTSNAHSSLAGHLGRVVGKGTASGHGSIKFDCPEHGVLMCIYSLVPQVQYDSTRIDPMNTKISRFDFFTPEFENLGMQPLESKYISFFTPKDKPNENIVVGWQPRYSEYKTALDINHGQFVENDSLSGWSVGRFRRYGLFSGLHKIHLKINPSMLDDIFPIAFDGKEDTDCVFGGCNFNIVKVSDMSVDGMPRV